MDVTKLDEGEYTCIAKNKAGESEKELSLKVFVKPKITYIVNRTASEMEEQVTVTCEASGDPTPTISWSYETLAHMDALLRNSEYLSPAFQCQAPMRSMCIEHISQLVSRLSLLSLLVVGPLGDGLASLIRVWPGRVPRGATRPPHQAISGESRPQAWLQGGTLAPPYRAMSRALIY
ncbi:hypothetical protein CRENBAI_006103 [Crenichthys baileyi]|uniref:Ig-like domain-containing protein n=1 Tax=Crenichthys baileyi TaxID=28760 RepID=A0AAV9S8L0_9TELE